jgi:hypothetical protein
MIDTILVEAVLNLRHPFGAKGVGEVSIVPPLAAVANAVSHAVGRRLRQNCPGRRRRCSRRISSRPAVMPSRYRRWTGGSRRSRMPRPVLRWHSL